MKGRDPNLREGGALAWTLGLVLLVLLGGLQISSLADWGRVRVDFLLAAAMAWAALSGPRRGLIFGMASGIVEDFLIGGGIRFTVLRALMAFVAGTVRPVLNVRQAAIIVPLVVAASLAQEAFLGLLFHNWDRFVAVWIPTALANAVVSWPVYLLVRTIWRPGGKSAAASPRSA
ncbi:MAG: rod shape-determining protein MreD [Candidatus Sericytochromatia bacterium]|uniref:Rod shape-determining protein MreD n=1 Tax=Candidatus Tanganyikabacteria bacterium TaxID=2961651 RepID=A0A938BM41_9BACT|nr:rod shape-determining protein MreD [Candidatus Tanganyikabacteria bacterium]